MNQIFNFELFLIMILYGILSGTSIYCLKVGVKKVKGVEMTIKGLFRNPIISLFKVLRVPIIFIGALLSVAGFLIYQYALSIYLLSDVKPLTNLNLIFLFLWGFLLLKERISKLEICGISIMTLGVVFVSMFATEKAESGTQINLLTMITFSIIAVILCLLFFILTLIRRTEKTEAYFFAISSGILFGLGVVFNNGIFIDAQYTLRYFITNPYVYLLVISYFFALFIEVLSLSRGRLVYVGPIINILTVGVPVLGAFIIFNEALVIPFDGALVIPLSFIKIIGIVLILIGTLVIYPRIEKLKKLTDSEDMPKGIANP